MKAFRTFCARGVRAPFMVSSTTWVRFLLLDVATISHSRDSRLRSNVVLRFGGIEFGDKFRRRISRPIDHGILETLPVEQSLGIGGHMRSLDIA